jgi:serine phosphatase RsbU (regulator of sigma subunit)
VRHGQGQAAGLDIASLLTAVEDAPPVAAAEVVGELLAERFGAADVAFLIADFSGEALIRLTHAGTPTATRTQGSESAERVALAGTPQGRALAGQALVVEERVDDVLVVAPVTNRGEAIGVLELTLAAPPGEDELADVALAAHALAYIVIANRRFTDLYEWGQRSVPLSLAAEIQHRLLPGAYTCEGGEFTVAAWLEPAGDIAGDTFDFSVERDVLHLSMTDAMGHAVEAAMLATVLVGALRNARRAGAGLAEQAALASDALADQTSRSQFVTGQLVRVDLRAGTASIVNAGHPPPLRLRDGRVAPVELAADVPFAIAEEPRYRVQELDLRPGDRLLFVTDGMLERNAASVDIAGLVERCAHMHARETVRHLVRALLDTTGGRLADDATIMCLDWHGGTRPRRSRGGSDGRQD